MAIATSKPDLKKIKPGTPDYNKILNTAKLTAGSVALLYDFDVDVAVNEAFVAVENNGLKAVVQTVKIAGKLVNIAVKKMAELQFKTSKMC